MFEALIFRTYQVLAEQTLELEILGSISNWQAQSGEPRAKLTAPRLEILTPPVLNTFCSHKVLLAESFNHIHAASRLGPPAPWNAVKVRKEMQISTRN